MSIRDIALLGAAVVYGTGAVIVGHAYWKALPQMEVDEAVAWVELTRIPDWWRFLTPVVRATTRPAWAALHGLAWPRELWHQIRRTRRGDSPKGG